MGQGQVFLSLLLTQPLVVLTACLPDTQPVPDVFSFGGTGRIEYLYKYLCDQEAVGFCPMSLIFSLPVEGLE